ncbi:jouberin, partial [Pyxicephalus adspersus]|uniref:jouberin n=1 Tax=Pyxicephalus adspersus TaxID=30357 RepID=UPI003B5AF9E9
FNIAIFNRTIFFFQLKTFTNNSSKDISSEVITAQSNNIEEGPFSRTIFKEQIAAEKESNTDKEHQHTKHEKKKKKKKAEVDDNAEPIDSQPGSPELVTHISGLEGDQVKRSRRKKKSILKEESHPTDFDDEDHLIEAYRLQVSQEETDEIKEKIKKKLQAHLLENFSSSENPNTVLSNQAEKKSKKKKKKDLVETEPETSAMSLSELQQTRAEVFDQPPHRPFPEKIEEADPPKRKGKKSKKKSHTDELTENSQEVDEEKSGFKRVYDDSLVLGVYIHRADKLKTDLVTSRPMVKIYLIDQRTGEFVKKESSALILDVASDDNTITNSDFHVKEKGFHKIAWAFLKVVGANEVLNVDKKLRLQLYYPPRSRISSNTAVYNWWLKYPRNQYPSTLYVTIKGLKLPENVYSVTNLGLPFGSNLSNADLHDVAMKGSDSGDTKQMKENFKWTRLPGQACRIPNRKFLSLRAGQMGCSYVCFSNDGRILAAACANRDGYPICLYEIPSGHYLRDLHGHLNVVYDLCWSSNDQYLLSASSDATARLWSIAMEASSAIKVLPHPSFVYTSKFHPMSNDLVVTGCYDAVIRVWNVKVKEINGQLLQELEGHTSFINTLCFDAEGLHMYSGDSSGLIIVWNTGISQRWQHNPADHWAISKEIKENDMKGIAVNNLQVHPNGRRLLIHTKDSTVRIMDLRILAAKKYIGTTNYKEKLHSAFTPCGTFIMAGSEDGMAYVWNAETGDQVAKYSELSYTAPLRDVAFHPHEHMVAFCAFGPNQPILVYIYDYKVAQLEAESVHSDVSSYTDALTRQDSLVAARSSMRMMKVKQKLDSVLNGSSVLLPAPSLLSPHSKVKLAQEPSTQLQAINRGPSGGFSPVGQPLSRTPSIRLQMINTEAKVSSLKVEADSGLTIQETVVALYDYTAHRSDELSLHRSDIIHVLYKDNDNWWFGILQNGQQGYFPANYVAAEILYDEDLQTPSASHFNNSQDVYNAEGHNQSPHRMSAVPSKSKALKFMSQHDTDADSPVTQKTRQRTRQMTASPDLISQPLAFSMGSSSGAEWDLLRQDHSVKPKKKSFQQSPTVGKTNAAFVPDE